MEGTHETKEFSNEAGCTRDSNVGQGEGGQDEGEEGHNHNEAPVIAYGTRVVSFILDTNQEEEGARDEPVGYLEVDASVNTVEVVSKQGQGGGSAVAHRTISHDQLNIDLGEGSDRAVDDTKDTKHHHLGCERFSSCGEQRDRIPNHTVCTLLLEYGRLYYRSRCRGFDVGRLQPDVLRYQRYFYCKANEEG